MKLQWEGYNKSFKQENNIPDDYIAYWKFNGNTIDETGDHNATNHGAVLTTDRFGNTDRAYYFDGSTKYMVLDNRFDSSVKNMTLSVWAYIQDEVSAPWSTKDILRQEGKFYCRVKHRGEAMSFTVDTPSSSSNWDPHFVTTLKKWYHFVYSYDGSQMKIYIDNVLEFTNNRTGDMNDNNSLCVIGRAVNANNEHWEGKLADMRFYDRALTLEEIDSLYNESNPI